MIFSSKRKIYLDCIVIISFLLCSLVIMPPGVYAEEHSSKLNLTIPGGVLVIQKVKGQENKTILVQDHLSSTKVLVNQNGNIEKSPIYYPYGNTVDQNTSKIHQTNRYYTAQRKVTDESDLYNYNARYYNPNTGIFIQPDSVQGPTRYTYVAGNPVQANDPTGNDQCETDPGLAFLWRALGNCGGEQAEQGEDFLGEEGLSSIGELMAAVDSGPGFLGSIAGRIADKLTGDDTTAQVTDSAYASLSGGAALGMAAMSMASPDPGDVGRGERIVGLVDSSLLSYSRVSEPANLARIPVLEEMYGSFIGAGSRGMVFADKAKNMATKIFYDVFPRYAAHETELLKAGENYGLFPRFIGQVEGGVQMEYIRGVPSNSRIIPRGVAVSASSRLIAMHAGGLNWEFKPEHIMAELGDDGVVTGLRLLDVGDFTQRSGPLSHRESSARAFMEHVGLRPWSAMKPNDLGYE